VTRCETKQRAAWPSTPTHRLVRRPVGPDDPRYGDLVGRASKRFAGKPDDVRVVCSSEQVVQAVQDAVREQLRVAVRSGGHCLEAVRADPAVRVVIDTSLMTGVEYDPEVVAGRGDLLAGGGGGRALVGQRQLGGAADPTGRGE
jgi:hypothetical protein